MNGSKDLTIIGKGTGWELAPRNGCETWGITQLILRRPVSLVIDMNVYQDGRWGDSEQRDAEKAKALCETCNIPYIHLGNYPLQDVVGRFGTDYFTNTVDYAMALALFRGYDHLDLYGVNMLHHTEYAYQKPGVDFWCGVAIGMGVKVRVFGEISTIMRTRDGLLYGYDIPQRNHANGKQKTEEN